MFEGYKKEEPKIERLLADLRRVVRILEEQANHLADSHDYLWTDEDGRQIAESDDLKLELADTVDRLNAWIVKLEAVGCALMWQRLDDEAAIDEFREPERLGYVWSLDFQAFVHATGWMISPEFGNEGDETEWEVSDSQGMPQGRYADFARAHAVVGYVA